MLWVFNGMAGEKGLVMLDISGEDSDVTDRDVSVEVTPLGDGSAM